MKKNRLLTMFIAFVLFFLCTNEVKAQSYSDYKSFCNADFGIVNYNDQDKKTGSEINEELKKINSKFNICKRDSSKSEELDKCNETRENSYKELAKSCGGIASSNSGNGNSGNIGDNPVDCTGMAPLIAFVMKIFKWICIVMGIALVIFGMLDFGGAVMSSDADAMKKASKKFTTRCIVFVIMIFLPVLIDYVVEELFFHGQDVDSCLAVNVNADDDSTFL